MTVPVCLVTMSWQSLDTPSLTTVTKGAGLRGHAAAFVDLVAAELLGLGPSLVGLTATFMQNVPSLSVAKSLKEIEPGLTIPFGACEGAESGPGLLIGEAISYRWNWCRPDAMGGWIIWCDVSLTKPSESFSQFPESGY